MLGITIGHRVARHGRLGPDGRPTVTVTDLAGTGAAPGENGGGADPAAALATSLGDVTGEEAVLGMPASADRADEARLRQAAEDAGLRVSRIVPEPVAVALHYGAIDEGVHRTVLVADQTAAAVDLTTLAIRPDLTVRVVTTRTAPLAGDAALAAISGELRASEPDAVLLSGGLYAAPEQRAAVENLPEAQGLTVRCVDPEAAAVGGLLLLKDFGLLRVVADRTPVTAPTVPLLEDPEPRLEAVLPRDPDPRAVPARDVPGGAGAEARTARQSGTDEPSAARGEPADPGVPRVPTAPARPESHRRRAEDGPGPAPAHTPRPAPDHEPYNPVRERTPAHDPVPAPDLPPEPGPWTETGPSGATAPVQRSVPVPQLQAVRRDDHLLVLWAWPDSALTARVRWRREGAMAGGDGPRDGDVLCRRRVYEHDGGLDLPVGRGAVTLTVEALVSDPVADTEGAATLRIPAEPPIVDYEPSLRRRLTGARTASVTFTARSGCELPALRIVHGLGRYRPSNTAEGTVLLEVPAQRITAGVPIVVEFPFPSTKGPSWLVCFPVDGPEPDRAPETDLRPTALHRLRVT
ncbi:MULTISPECIES: Hsp70 family protein [unclassified Streptomyces]|uniref:Hsp70 family protein n=1 Tax=unclassified Streptomyces TaxID=2593676 RepID=UPI000DAB3C52|nr:MULTISPECIES: Hsp70 family protein [unclassified Streptomyces]PZT73686.1 hypothetical protein DNK55_15705 [Streptomyces sp. AC1-42T]PZT83320.1 hypothetical protein DNK56_15720 [Streptomyces sp. AC1-42W]